MIGLSLTLSCVQVLKALITWQETMAAITQMGKAGNMLSHIITAYGDVHLDWTGQGKLRCTM